MNNKDRNLFNELKEGTDHLSKLPKSGDKIVFKGVKPFWYWSMIKAAKALLEIDKEYTVKKCEPLSSWTAVELEEFPGERFSLSWFEFN